MNQLAVLCSSSSEEGCRRTEVEDAAVLCGHFTIPLYLKKSEEASAYLQCLNRNLSPGERRQIGKLSMNAKCSIKQVMLPQRREPYHLHGAKTSVLIRDVLL